jgi:hypothetical protein
VVGGN